jgi:hypothetical protein
LISLEYFRGGLDLVFLTLAGRLRMPLMSAVMGSLPHCSESWRAFDILTYRTIPLNNEKFYKNRSGGTHSMSTTRSEAKFTKGHISVTLHALQPYGEPRQDHQQTEGVAGQCTSMQGVSIERYQPHHASVSLDQ